MISLVKDTIDNRDIDNLVEWLKTYPRLTKGELTKEFERKWSEWVGVKHSVFVNSGSSANLAMVHALNYSNFRNRKIVVPSVAWSTTVAPVIQLGFEPLVCDSDKKTLSLDLNHFKGICKKHNPFVVIVVNPLGMIGDMDQLKVICDQYDVKILEDSCETVGTTYKGNNAGTFGSMSSFSFYFGHHMSTIEGGMVCTDDDELYDLLLMIRSHGWDRDLSSEKQKSLRESVGVDDFNALYTFYITGFNIRSTDLQAKIGLCQLDKLDGMCEVRNRNFKLYQDLIINDEWKPNPVDNDFISNFAYPIIHPNRDKISQSLIANDIECRPLICGSMCSQPFFKKEAEVSLCDWSRHVHAHGMYVPNNDKMTEDEVRMVCDIVNKETVK